MYEDLSAGEVMRLFDGFSRGDIYLPSTCNIKASLAELYKELLMAPSKFSTVCARRLLRQVESPVIADVDTPPCILFYCSYWKFAVALRSETVVKCLVLRAMNSRS